MVLKQSRREPVLVFSKPRGLGWVGLWRVGGWEPYRLPNQNLSFLFKKKSLWVGLARKDQGSALQPIGSNGAKKRDRLDIVLIL